jgi:hypothetical protein
VMVPGSGPGATVSSSPAECCSLCARTRGCNVWVACTDPWCGSQCWLKWIADPSNPTTRNSGATNPWTSGTIHKDVPAEQPVPSRVANGRLGPSGEDGRAATVRVLTVGLGGSPGCAGPPLPLGRLCLCLWAASASASGLRPTQLEPC